MADQIKIENKFFIAPNLIFELNLKPIEISVYMYLVRCGNNSTAFPSYSTIGKKAGVSRDCAINTVKKLIDKKLVIKHERTKDIKKKKDGKIITLHDSNVYEVVINLDSLVVEDDQGSNSERPPLVVEDDPINNYIKNNYEKELIEKELNKNNYSSEQKNESEEQKPSPVESDDSTNNSENNNNSDEPKKPKKKEKLYDPESQEFKAAKYLFSLMVLNDPKAKVPDFQKWAYHIDLLARVDKRTFVEVKKVIDWCQNDGFWKGNILSTKKLREQFSRLLILSEGGNNNNRGHNINSNFNEFKEALKELKEESEQGKQGLEEMEVFEI